MSVSYLPLHMSFSADVCTCPFRRMVCYTLHSWGCLTPPKRARIALGEQGRRPFPCLVCTIATCACVAALGPSITSLPTSASPTCPSRRMVCTGCYTCLLFVLFAGWSARPTTCPFGVYTFWRMVCTCCAFGEWCRPCTLHPTLPQARQHTLYAGLSLWNLDIKTFWAHLWPLPSKRGKAAQRHGTKAQQLPLPSPSLKSTYVKIRDATSCSRGAFCGISVVLSPSSNVHDGRISLGGQSALGRARGGCANGGLPFMGWGLTFQRGSRDVLRCAASWVRDG